MQVLVYGAGQLAQMMYLDGVPLGITVSAVDVNQHLVVHPVSKTPLDISLADAIAAADVLTVEFEHVPEDLLEQAKASGKLSPNMDAILVGADRVREKQLLEGLGIANCAHRIVSDIAQLDACVADLGERLILKSSRDGYDGYGQWRLSAAEQLPQLKQQLAKLDLNRVPLVVEQMLDFEREVSIIGARSLSGEIKVYPVAENLHHEGQLQVSVAPATHLDGALLAQAQHIFSTLAKGLDYVGVLAVELFQCGDRLVVNELAPRVHNSGHWTQVGAATSQFANHLRAITDMPLGAVTTLGGEAAVSAMINVIGCHITDVDMLNIDGVHVHWYGKSVRAKRKMGHINVTANGYAALGKKLQTLSQYLPEDYFPLIEAEARRLAAIGE